MGVNSFFHKNADVGEPLEINYNKVRMSGPKPVARFWQNCLIAYLFFISVRFPFLKQNAAAFALLP